MHRTAFFKRHQRLGAKMTEFHGWEMPLHYGSIVEEHLAVRRALGVFDVSHMGQAVITGSGAEATLNGLIASDLTQVGEGRACYTVLLNEAGGIVDDLIIFRVGPDAYLAVVNCANRLSDVEWIRAHRQGRVEVADVSEGRAILAVQGPRASHVLEQLLDARVTGLGRFGVAPIRTMGPDACVARTGYTGGDGFELLLPEGHAVKLWDAIVEGAAAVGAKPVGLGARDSLRVEAGLRLYGADIDESTTPFEADLGWTVAMKKPQFIGREALAKQREAGVTRKFVGFGLSEAPVPRAGCELRRGGAGDGTAGPVIGRVTSGTFSPMLNRTVGMGYVEPSASAPGTKLTVTVRARQYPATVVKLPFWKGERQPPGVGLQETPALEQSQ